jgi:hypothetical protein
VSPGTELPAESMKLLGTTSIPNHDPAAGRFAQADA